MGLAIVLVCIFLGTTPALIAWAKGVPTGLHDDRPVYYVHKYTTAQVRGGPEEGGWWYDLCVPEDDWLSETFRDEEEAYVRCRELNASEHERRDSLDYEYTSVLSFQEDFYCYDVTDEAVPRVQPETRPYYE